jgi:hypothetical protein
MYYKSEIISSLSSRRSLFAPTPLTGALSVTTHCGGITIDKVNAVLVFSLVNYSLSLPLFMFIVEVLNTILIAKQFSSALIIGNYFTNN